MSKMVTDSLGIVTAFAYAKQNGYTGTEEEFGNLLASLQDVADSASRAEAAVEPIETDVDQILQELVDARTDTEGTVHDSIGDANREMFAALASKKIDGAYVEDGYLYMTSGDEIVVGPLGPFSGGGGGSGSSAELTLTNTSGWLYKAIMEGADCPVSFTWTSLEGGIATGNGTVKIQVNNITKSSSEIQQGEVTLNVGPYLSSGSNVVRVTVMDIYGNSKMINYTVNCVSVSLKSSFDGTIAYSGAINYYYTPYGAAAKTVHFILDGTELGTATVPASATGKQQNYAIPEQTHGAHTLRVYFECEIEETTIRSNELYYELICTTGGNTTPIIASEYNTTTAEQYTALKIPYVVYDPENLTAEIELIVNGVTDKTLTVDRNRQTWVYRANDTGALTLAIKCGNTTKTFSITVTESDMDVEPETSNLALYLTSYGRSNAEEHPEVWKSGTIESTLTGFNWANDGWQADANGDTVLRVVGDARVTVPYQLFASDFRATGKTIEVEFATRDVMDYDAVIMSCMSGDRGLQITAQSAALASEQSNISTQYKDGEHVRIAFVVQKAVENRLVFIYINGIASGVVQYPVNDDFAQQSPVGIQIGSNLCGVDIYNIRVYDNDLTHKQIVENWIADTADIDDKVDRYTRNNVYDEYGNIVTTKLPSDLPYMILEAPELPQYKGDKKTVSGSYVDPLDPSKSFTFTEAQFDVQGTSSQYYERKNYKAKFKGGFDNNGIVSKTYKMRNNSVGTDTFCFKADVASSEGANNVELARLYNDTCVYKTPYQQENSSVRQGIDGFPIVVFWDNGEDTTFLGKYNFNNDKGTEEVFGFETGDESWEIKNNTSNRVIWKSDDFSGSDWLNDFEGRYPDGNEDPTNLQELASWLRSTDQTQATGDYIGEVTYGDQTYSYDTADYRRAKFRAELADHMEVNAVLFYYLFTELFLMVDSRAKNAFPTFMSGSKWFSLPYDFDTALGINNEGALVFGYQLEDIDQLEGGANVFNGQNSVLWVNLRETYADEIMEMYRTLRSTGALSYAKVEAQFEEHQNKWPESIFNEDAWYKYIDPLVSPSQGKESTAAYLSMMQGSKTEQRKWWLYNRFRYMDSKYNAGDAASDVITLRGYAKDNISIKPYAYIYATIKYGSYLVQERANRGQTYTLLNPLDEVNDTEIYIYSASQLSEIGDLSGLKVGYANFAMATKLQALKLGDADVSYYNGNLKELYLGNNTLLKTLDVRNCAIGTGDQKSVDIQGCSNIEDIYFDGTSITGIDLPNGGIIKKLHLPSTITNLTIRNQKSITEFVLPDYSNITTLWLENVSSAVNVTTILNAIAANSRVRLIGFTATAESVEAVHALCDKLDTMRGLDERGGNVDAAQVSGTIRVPVATTDQAREIKQRYSGLNLVGDSMTYRVSFYDGVSTTALYSTTVAAGGTVEDPVQAGTIEIPTKPAGETKAYAFIGWDTSLENVQSDLTVTATYEERDAYMVTFTNYDGTVLHRQSVASGSDCPDPVKNGTISAPTKPADASGVYTYLGWTGASLINVTSARTVTARYATATSYKVTFANYDGTELLVQYVASGTNLADPVTIGLINEPTRPDDDSGQYRYTYNGWNSALTNITAAKTITAQYTSTKFYFMTFNDYDGTELVKTKILTGQPITDPIATGDIQTPTRAPETDYGYIFKAWSPTISGNATANKTYTATYKTDQHFTVWFMDYDGTTILDEQSVLDSEAALDPVTSGRISTPLREPTAQYEYTWTGWNKTFSSITEDTTVTATYSQTTRSYTVTWYDADTLQQMGTSTVLYNGTATFTGNKPGVSNPEDYVATGYSPTNISIKADTDIYVTFETGTITDSWVQIAAASADGTYATKYSTEGTKVIDLGSKGRIIAKYGETGLDELASGSGNANMTWVFMYQLPDNHRWNPLRSGSSGAYNEGTGTIGGYEESELRSYISNDIFNALPLDLQSAIKEVKKYSKGYDVDGTTVVEKETIEKLFALSGREVFGGTSYEANGPVYSNTFPNTSSRIRNKVGASASGWWVRSASSATNALYVYYGGYFNYIIVNYNLGVVLGFCI